MILRVQEITRRFGGLVAVDAVTFEVAQDEIVSLIGPNGAGKTTLFNVIAGSLAPNSGRILFDGGEITGHGSAQICARGLARTFQIPQPFLSMDVLSCVMVGAFNRTRSITEAQERARSVLRRVGMSDRVQASAGALTTAGKKRLEIARALATGPRMLLLDEVMAGLNTSEVAEVLELIRALRAEGIAVLLVEHNLEAVMNVSDRIIVLDQGKLIAQGAPQEVVHRPDVIRAYLGEDVVDAPC